MFHPVISQFDYNATLFQSRCIRNINKRVKLFIKKQSICLVQCVVFPKTKVIAFF